jgi:ATP-dependent helicase/nuclease subunit A
MKEHTLQIHRQLGVSLRVARGDGDRADTRLGALIKRRIKEEEGAEAARLLYVALTRARDMLYLCGKSEASLGTWFQSFDLLHDVSGAAHGQLLPGSGWNGEVIRNLPEARGVATVKSVKSDDDIDAMRRRIAPAAVPQRAVESISVSKLLVLMVPGEADPEEARYERTKEEEDFRQFAMDRGTLVHRMFELWDFAGAAPDLRTLVRAAGLGLGRRGALEKELAALCAWFSASPLGARLAGEKTLLREAPFSLRVDDTIVNGTIDLALRDGTIIDYKTGKIKDESSARYEKQLLLYAAALRDLAGIAPKEGFLVYVDAHEVKRVEFSADRIAGTLKDAREALWRDRLAANTELGA